MHVCVCFDGVLTFVLLVVSFVVTGASRGYAFVEFETEREMRRAYKVVIYCFNSILSYCFVEIWIVLVGA